MTIALIVASTSAFAARVAHITGHNILCGICIAMAMLFILSAMACEGRILSRIKKLEEEFDNLKRRYYHDS